MIIICNMIMYSTHDVGWGGADLIPAGAHATMTLAFSISFEVCRSPLC